MAAEPPYSRIRRAGPLLLTAGILGRRDGAIVGGGATAELAQALANLGEPLVSEGLTFDDVVRLVVYLVDVDDLAAANDQFVQTFAVPRPTRTTVVVRALPGGARVEIEATAATRP